MQRTALRGFRALSALTPSASRPLRAACPSALRTFHLGTKVLRIDEQDGKHVPFGELGSGYYSDNTKGCYDVIDNSKPMMLEACLAVLESRRQRGAVNAREPFVIADYGCADAGTSLPLMHDLVAMIREAEPYSPIELRYMDQTTNDWSSVFKRLWGDIPSTGGFDPQDTRKNTGILSQYSQLTAVATGGSFYNNCFPRESVDLMFSSTAMHWFRRIPIPMQDVLHESMLDKKSFEYQAFKETAFEDWKKILQERALELKTGGRFGLVSFAHNSHGHFLGKSGHVKESMHAKFCEIWQDFVSQGKITQDEFVNTNFPMKYRTIEEYLRPFGGGTTIGNYGTEAAIIKATDGGLRGACAFEGLTVIGANYGEVRCPYHERWMNEAEMRKSQGKNEAEEAKAHAKRYVPTTRTWSNSTFESGLSDSRSAEEKAAITEDMFQQYEAMVAAAPEDHAMDYQHVYMMIEKNRLPWGVFGSAPGTGARSYDAEAWQRADPFRNNRP